MCKSLNSASRCRYAQRLKHYVFSVVILMAVWLADSTLFAAPITFHFDATISSIQGDVPSLNLPFPLVLGQSIAGSYSFADVQDIADIFLQPQLGKQGHLDVEIEGTKIFALINSGELNGGGPVDIDNPPPAARSSIFLGYFSPTNAFPGWGGSVSGHPFDSRLWLVGPEGTISGPESLLDFDKWQAQTILRRIDLEFGYFESGTFKSVIVKAPINNFSLVPEPPLCECVLVLLLVTGGYLRRSPRFRTC